MISSVKRSKFRLQLKNEQNESNVRNGRTHLRISSCLWNNRPINTMQNEGCGVFTAVYVQVSKLSGLNQAMVACISPLTVQDT